MLSIMLVKEYCRLLPQCSYSASLEHSADVPVSKDSWTCQAAILDSKKVEWLKPITYIAPKTAAAAALCVIDRVGVG